MVDKKNYANGQDVYKQEENKLTYYYKNGQVKAEGPYENDKMEREWKFYKETGQLWQIGNFLNDQKHGTWIRFNKDGQEEYNEEFKDGKIIKVK